MKFKHELDCADFELYEQVKKSLKGKSREELQRLQCLHSTRMNVLDPYLEKIYIGITLAVLLALGGYAFPSISEFFDLTAIYGVLMTVLIGAAAVIMVLTFMNLAKRNIKDSVTAFIAQELIQEMDLSSKSESKKGEQK